METLNSPRYFLFVRTAAWLETSLGLGLLLAISYLFSQGDHFINTAPHPFWIIVLLITTQYGLGAGIFSATCATAALFMGNAFSGPLAEEHHLEYLMRVGHQPFLWFVASIILGTLRSFHLQEEKALHKRIKTLQKQTELLAESYKKIQSAKKSLLLRLASYTDKQEKIYKGVWCLNRLNMQQISEGLIYLIGESLQANKFSLYLYNNTHDRFELYRSFGWREDESFVVNISLISPLGQALTRQSILCVNQEEDAAVLENEGLLAGMLVDSSSHKPLGLIKVEETAFLSLHSQNLESFKYICGLLSQSIANFKRSSVHKKGAKREMVYDS